MYVRYVKFLNKTDKQHRKGGNHDIYRRGSDIEKVPRHKEINENLARMILRKWKLL